VVRPSFQILTLVLLATWGCASMRGPDAQLASGHGEFDSASFVYRVRRGKEGDSKDYTLFIKYPHPGGKKGYARAEVVVEKPATEAQAAAQDSWSNRLSKAVLDNSPGLSYADGIERAKGLDLPLTEVDEVVYSLDKAGYFNARSTPNAPAILVTKVDGAEYRKRCERVAHLDQLMNRVEAAGSLVSLRQGISPSEYAVPNEGGLPSGESLVERLPPVTSQIR
jgi:hypothetical protein